MDVYGKENAFNKKIPYNIHSKVYDLPLYISHINCEKYKRKWLYVSKQ